MLPEDPGPAIPQRRGEMPHVAICALIHAEQEYAWDLVVRSLVGLDYPAECRRLLLVTGGGSTSLEAAALRFGRTHQTQFAQLRTETAVEAAEQLARPSAANCFTLNRLTSIAAVRQRMLEWVLDAEQPAAEYALFLDGATLWPRHAIRSLLALAAEYGGLSAGVAPGEEASCPVRMTWCTSMPVGRHDAYEAADVPALPFPVDLTPLDGTLVPAAALREFQASGGWYAYAASGYPENGQGDHAYLLLGNRRRLPVWVDPGVVGWQVGREGMARRFRHHPETGVGEILTTPLEAGGAGA